MGILGILLFLMIVLASALAQVGSNRLEFFSDKLNSAESALSLKITEAVKKEAIGDTKPIFKESTYIATLDNSLHFTEKQLQNYFEVKKLPMEKYYMTNLWSFKNDKCIAASAAGIDDKHHFVNGYLIGYEPFKTVLLWVPHYVVSMRLKYRLDSKLGLGSPDIWQTSKQAFINAFGDCEDHALVIADWLIAMGIDARVVLGDVGKEGHAWVVVFKDSKIYLLEATDKQRRNSWRHYPLAHFSLDYHPSYMFNRDYFWVNVGNVFLPNYNEEKWSKRSRFFLAS